jgi:hypothetical protein
MAEIDDTDGLEAAALRASGLEGGSMDGPPDDLERCEHCGALKPDEFDRMTEQQLLDHGRQQLLRSFGRGFRDGTITHQEKAILMGFLRLQGSKLPVETKPEPDEELPAPGRTALPQHSYDDTGYDETKGG